jgi:protein phosphatase
MRRREITPSAARQHPRRHVLTRALGVRRRVEPDLAELTAMPGDSFILCSDGLTGHVSDGEIARVLCAERDLHVASQALIDLANDRGGEDNITVVLVCCEKSSD